MESFQGEEDPKAFHYNSKVVSPGSYPSSVQISPRSKLSPTLVSGSPIGYLPKTGRGFTATVMPELAKVQSQSVQTHQMRDSQKYTDYETEGSTMIHLEAAPHRKTLSYLSDSLQVVEGQFAENLLLPDERSEVSPPDLMPSNLKAIFDDTLACINEHPIEYYESLMYDTTRFFALELGGELPKLEAIEMYHPIKKLQEKLDEIGEGDRGVLMQATEDLIEKHTFTQLDYKFLTMAMELISGLLVKWKLIHSYEYTYRNREAVFSSKLIDIVAINRSIVSMEVLYFASIANKSPLANSLHQTVKQYASLVLGNVYTLMEAILSLTNANFSKVSSISGYLAAMNNQLALKYGFVPDYTTSRPEFHRLSLKTGCLALCMSSSKERINLALKNRLIEFEMAYRYFETVLIKDLAHMKAEV